MVEEPLLPLAAAQPEEQSIFRKWQWSNLLGAFGIALLFAFLSFQMLFSIEPDPSILSTILPLDLNAISIFIATSFLICFSGFMLDGCFQDNLKWKRALIVGGGVAMLTLLALMLATEFIPNLMQMANLPILLGAIVPIVFLASFLTVLVVEYSSNPAWKPVVFWVSVILLLTVLTLLFVPGILSSMGLAVGSPSLLLFSPFNDGWGWATARISVRVLSGVGVALFGIFSFAPSFEYLFVPSHRTLAQAAKLPVSGNIYTNELKSEMKPEFKTAMDLYLAAPNELGKNEKIQPLNSYKLDDFRQYFEHAQMDEEALKGHAINLANLCKGKGIDMMRTEAESPEEKTLQRMAKTAYVAYAKKVGFIDMMFNIYDTRNNEDKENEADKERIINKMQALNAAAYGSVLIGIIQTVPIDDQQKEQEEALKNPFRVKPAAKKPDTAAMSRSETTPLESKNETYAVAFLSTVTAMMFQERIAEEIQKTRISPPHSKREHLQSCSKIFSGFLTADWHKKPTQPIPASVQTSGESLHPEQGKGKEVLITHV